MTAQESVDAFARARGPCCAGCDWWRWHTVAIGECTRSAPVAATQRVAMLGVTALSLRIGAGHVLTPRDHVCGDFQDTQA